jgi:hypothetical protein
MKIKVKFQPCDALVGRHFCGFEKGSSYFSTPHEYHDHNPKLSPFIHPPATIHTLSSP